MLTDSVIWKRELSNEIDTIEAFYKDTDLNYDAEYEESEDDLVEERDMLWVSYITFQKFTIYTSIIVRKLIEANKISDQLLAKNYSIVWYNKKTTKPVTALNWFEIEVLFDIETETKMSISLKDLTDIFIHSFHFIPKYNYYEEDDTESETLDYEPEVKNILGVYFSSDKTKNKLLYYISLDKYIEILKVIIADEIVKIEIKGGVITKKSNKF